MRLIDADVMVNVMLFNPEQEEYYTERMTIEETLDLFTEEGCPKTADRPQGKWVPFITNYYKCSLCGKEMNVYLMQEYNFCPNCGAKMKGARG